MLPSSPFSLLLLLSLFTPSALCESQVVLKTADECWSACHFPGFAASSETYDAFDKCWVKMLYAQRNGDAPGCPLPCYLRRRPGEELTFDDHEWIRYTGCFEKAMLYDYGVPQQIYHIYYNPKLSENRMELAVHVFPWVLEKRLG
ncbi:hypothetical protein BJ508DRAFT_323121 [Ascobolus immersus RN42]|uniref:WSC domain-containing protein n=1 Tax=Ascobolus immersus RN42 TaxID=1160509 RepID=A0A3N4IHN7_ASCIM|nr:hypothetical protein BJ508DRAFT_323121 [Ascobolus immersus RN42]